MAQYRRFTPEELAHDYTRAELENLRGNGVNIESMLHTDGPQPGPGEDFLDFVDGYRLKDSVIDNPHDTTGDLNEDLALHYEHAQSNYRPPSSKDINNMLMETAKSFASDFYEGMTGLGFGSLAGDAARAIPFWQDKIQRMDHAAAMKIYGTNGSLIREFEKANPKLGKIVEAIGAGDALDPETYADVRFVFRDPGDIFNVLPYITMKAATLSGTPIYNAVSQLTPFNPAPDDKSLDKWQRFHWANGGAVTSAYTLMKSIYENNTIPDIVTAFYAPWMPGMDRGKADTAISKVLKNAMPSYQAEMENDFPYAKAHPEEVFLAASIPLDIGHFAAPVLGRFAQLSKADGVEEMAKVMEKALDAAKAAVKEGRTYGVHPPSAEALRTWRNARRRLSRKMAPLEEAIGEIEERLKHHGDATDFYNKILAERESVEAKRLAHESAGEVAQAETARKRVERLDEVLFENDPAMLDADRADLKKLKAEHSRLSAERDALVRPAGTPKVTTLSSADRIDAGVAAFNAVFARETQGGAASLWDGSLARSLVTRMLRYDKLSGPINILDEATHAHHVLGFRAKDVPASQWLPFWGMWRNKSQLQAGELEGVQLAANDTMRAGQAQLRALLGSMDFEGRVKKVVDEVNRVSGTTTYTYDQGRRDMLKVLYSIDRHPGDVVGSMDRQLVLDFSKNKRLAGIPAGIIEIARDAAIMMGNGNSALKADWSTGIKKFGRALTKANREAANLTGKAGPSGKSAALDTTWAALNNAIAMEATKDERLVRLEPIMTQLDKMEENAFAVVSHPGIMDNDNIARERASATLRAVKAMREELAIYGKSGLKGGEVPPGKVLQAIQKSNTFQRLGQLFTVPATATMNMFNSLVEKTGFVIGAGLEELQAIAGGVGRYMKAGALPSPPAAVAAKEAAGDAAKLSALEPRVGAKDNVYPWPSVAPNGQILDFSADTSLGSVGVSGAAEEYPGFLGGLFQPTKMMAKGESLARNITGLSVFWKHFDEVTLKYPNMGLDARVARGLEAASAEVARVHFNSDDISAALQTLRLVNGYPDFTFRDFMFYADLAARHPAQVMAAGRALDYVRHVTGRDGIKVFDVPGTNMEVRWRPEDMVGLFRFYDKLTKWEPLTPDEERDAGALGYAARRVEHYAPQATKKLIGTLLPFQNLGLDLVSNRRALATTNAMESAMSSGSKYAAGTDGQLSDLAEAALSRNDIGKSRAMYQSIRNRDYALSQADIGRPVTPQQAAEEKASTDLLTRSARLVGSGIVFSNKGESEFQVKRARALSALADAEANGHDPEVLRAQMRVDPEMRNVEASLPMPNAAREAYEKSKQSIQLQPDWVGGQPPEPPKFTPAVETSTGQVPFYTALASGTYHELDGDKSVVAQPAPPKAAGMSADVLVPARQKFIYAPPKSYEYDPKIQMMVPTLDKAVGFFNWNKSETRSNNEMARRLGDILERSKAVAHNPTAIYRMLESEKDSNGVAWVIPELDNQRKLMREKGIPEDASTMKMVTLFNVLDIARKAELPDDSGVQQSTLIRDNIRRTGDWFLKEIRANPQNAEQLKHIFSNEELTKAFADGRLVMKPAALPKTFRPSERVDQYILDRVMESANDGTISQIVRAAHIEQERKYPAMKEWEQNFRKGIRSPGSMAGILDGFRDALEQSKSLPEGDPRKLPENAWALFSDPEKYGNLYPSIGMASTYDEAKPMLDIVFPTDQKGRRFVNPAAAFEVMHGEGASKYRPLMQAAWSRAYGDSIANTMNAWIENLDPADKSFVFKAIGDAPDELAAQRFAVQNAHLASGRFDWLDAESSTPHFVDWINGMRTEGMTAPARGVSAAPRPPMTPAARVEGVDSNIGLMSAAPMTRADGVDDRLLTIRTTSSRPMTPASIEVPAPAPAPYRTTFREILSDAAAMKAKDTATWNTYQAMSPVVQSMYKAEHGGVAPQPPKSIVSYAGTSFVANAQNAPAVDTAMIALQAAAYANQGIQGTYRTFIETGDIEPGGDLGAAMHGLNVFASTWSDPVQGAINLSTFGTYGVYAGVKSGLRFGDRGGPSREQQESAQIQRERLQLERERFQEQLRQQSIRDLQSRERDLANAVRGGGIPADRRGMVEARLAAFTRRPTYSSRIGLVDAVERAVGSQLKPRW